MPDTRQFPKLTPEQRQQMSEKAARFFKPMPEEDDLTPWVDMSHQTKGELLVGLLGLADAINTGKMQAGMPPHPVGRPLPFRLAELIRRIDEALDSAHVPHAFGGMIALAYHGQPRATDAIDVRIFVPAIEGRVSLHALHQCGVAFDLQRYTKLLRRDGRVWLHQGMTVVTAVCAAAPFGDACRERVVRVPFSGASIPILSLEDLVVCMAVDNREQDWLYLKEVLAVQGERLSVDLVRSCLATLLGGDDPRTRYFESLLAATPP
jgi:hypothetical protein